ncbi:MAG: hypothetical protein AAB152_07255 [Candidatus Coatesbacteria bacterium]
MRHPVRTVLFFMLLSSCYAQERVYVRGGPPPWAPAHGARRGDFYRYRYYQNAQVYYDVDRNVYFYVEVGSGNWMMAPSLPAYVVIQNDVVVDLEMVADRPYRYHGDVVKSYPPPPGRGEGDEKPGKGPKGKRGRGHGGD